VRDFVADKRFDVGFEGGLMAVSVDEAGRLEPRAAWRARLAEASIGSVIDELRKVGALVPPAPLNDRQSAGLPAELLAIYDATAEVQLSGWHLRPRASLEDIELPLHGDRSHVSVRRFLDLPDGTFLSYGWGQNGLYVPRLRADALAPLPSRVQVGDEVLDEVTGLTRPATAADAIQFFPPRRDSSEDPRAVPVVARSIAALLDRALDSGGAVDLPSLGTLFDSLSDWERRPPAPRERPPRGSAK
jgi:hypothetical protein